MSTVEIAHFIWNVGSGLAAFAVAMDIAWQLKRIADALKDSR